VNRKSAINLAWGVALTALNATAALPSVELNWPGPAASLLTNVAQVRRLAARSESVGCAVRLDGVVLWVSPVHDQLVLWDESGSIRVDLANLPALAPGQRAHLEGSGVAGHSRLQAALVDNDGLHPALEKSERIYLEAGRQPIRAEWFNGPASFDLSIEWEGPGLPRQRIPDTLLFRAQPEVSGETNPQTHGLDYRCFQGHWEALPDFDRLPATRTGTVTNFDLAARTRDQDVALQFSGYLEVPREGLYTFWLRSDDGSRLYVGETSLRLSILAADTLPVPRAVIAGETLTEEQEWQWVELEGTVLSLHFHRMGGLEAELWSGTNRVWLEVADASGQAPALFSQVRARGLCRSTDLESGPRALRRLLVPTLEQLEVRAAPSKPARLPAGTVAELRRLGESGRHVICPMRLQGLVLASSPTRGVLAFQDESGAALLETDLRGPPPRAGQMVALEGVWTVEGPRLVLSQPTLVDNDGVHSMAERTGTIYLKAGKQPLHLSWFNRETQYGLELYYQGPGLPRQRIPAGALFLPEIENGTVRWVQGVEYRCYEGAWPRVPDCNLLDPVREGTAANFDPKAASRIDRVGLEFSTYLEVPQDGLYTFSTVSDDGSLLFMDERAPRLEVIGTNIIAAPRPIAVRQVLTPDQQDQWTQVEGRVSFVGEGDGNLELELTSGTGRMLVEIAETTNCSPAMLLNSRVRVVGICRNTFTSDGQSVAGQILTPGMDGLELLELAPGLWTGHATLPISALGGTNCLAMVETLVHVRGRLDARKPGEPLRLADDTGQLLLETTQPPPGPQGALVEALGRWSLAGTNIVLRPAFYRELPDKTNLPATSLPLLTTIEQVKSLSRREAQRFYPVRIRGVVTSQFVGGFFIQDATWAIYVLWQNTIKTDLPQVGEYWEIEGITFANFAPNIRARRAVRLGTGLLPEPLRPTWDQLINGSFDSRYVEVQGVVTGIDADGMALLTRSGKIKLQLSDVESESLKRYENALIRVRGCVISGGDANTHQVELGRLNFSNASINVDEPAPGDPFAAPLKHIPDLLRFDPHASAIQRVKLAGQLLHRRHGEYFLVEGANGLRFVSQQRLDLAPGDLLEVVGFPELGGPSPVLREALARRTGHAPLPAPQSLSDTNLLSRRYDATLVNVEARLASVSSDRFDQILALQTGTRGFVARLDSSRGNLQDLLPGSHLELTGVYAGQGGDPASGRDIDSFELLLNSLLDIRVLQRPPWWNLRHTLMAGGAMGLVLLAATVWITLLRRKVEQRSLQLADVVRRHEQTERQRSLEEERSRIARDLHDDLGATLTEIRFLSALESRDSLVPAPARSQMGRISEKSLQMVASLDEIVWAVNPANDSLPHLATYLCQFAEEFLRAAPIRCRLDVDELLPQVPVTSEVRHNVYLAVREALNNVAKHSNATEVWLRIQTHDHSLAIVLQDNGRGFAPESVPGGEGLANMRRRVEKIGGRFDLETRPAAGTLCRIWLPLEVQVPNPAS
jgi:signal transduction histidine kinase